MAWLEGLPALQLSMRLSGRHVQPRSYVMQACHQENKNSVRKDYGLLGCRCCQPSRRCSYWRKLLSAMASSPSLLRRMCSQASSRTISTMQASRSLHIPSTSRAHCSCTIAGMCGVLRGNLLLWPAYSERCTIDEYPKEACNATAAT